MVEVDFLADAEDAFPAELHIDSQSMSEEVSKQRSKNVIYKRRHVRLKVQGWFTSAYERTR